jgi:hypothetical protein
MRHVWSLLAGLVIAPIVYLLMCLHLDSGRFELVLAVLAAAGLLLGVLGSLRTSPVGPILVGLLFITPTVLRETSSSLFSKIFLGYESRFIGDVEIDWGQAAISAVLPVVGVMLLVAAVSAQRWKRWPQVGVDSWVDTGRIEAAATWQPFPHDAAPTPTTTMELPADPDQTTAQLSHPWAPPPR